MLYIKIPKDLREYKQKVFMGRTTQELFWIALALIIGTTTFIICLFTVGAQVGSYVTMAVAFPIFICGFVTIQDMTTLEFLKKVIYFHRRKQYLTYHNDMTFYDTKKRKLSKKERRFKKRLKKIKENM